MKKNIRIGVSALMGLILAVAICAATISAQTPATPQSQSVSGKITAVEKASFTLAVGSEKSTLSNSPAGAKNMTFHLDQSTTIEGALKVGANADVTYREEGGKNIAISVHVS